MTGGVTVDIAGYLIGAQQDGQSITKDWEPLQPLIQGVIVQEMRNVMKDDGYLTEIYRDNWKGMTEIRHIFQEVLNPGSLTAWHLHATTTDRLFVSQGQMKIVLYDARKESTTLGCVNVFRLSIARPGLIVIPPGIWHGVMNIGSGIAVLLNLTDKAYEYENPDHWRLPPDTTQIPYRFV